MFARSDRTWCGVCRDVGWSVASRLSRHGSSPADSSGESSQDAYLGGVEELLELADVPPDAALLDYLRGQASPPSGPDDFTLGSWQLYARPDLVERLSALAPGWPLSAAYGIPLLASAGIAAVVALGSDWLAVRIDQLPPGIVTEDDPEPAWLSFAGDGWHILSPVQSQLPGADIGPALRQLVAAALANAASLASK